MRRYVTACLSVPFSQVRQYKYHTDTQTVMSQMQLSSYDFLYQIYSMQYSEFVLASGIVERNALLVSYDGCLILESHGERCHMYEPYIDLLSREETLKITVTFSEQLRENYCGFV